MKTRMARGIAAAAVFGALAISAVGGHGSVGAVSPDVTAQPITASAAAVDKIQGTSHMLFTVNGGAADSTGKTNGGVVIAVPAPVAGYLPLTKGGRFP
jgi:hypothetical protein